MVRPRLEPKQPLNQVGMRLEVIKVQKQSKLNFLQLCKSCLTEKSLVPITTHLLSQVLNIQIHLSFMRIRAEKVNFSTKYAISFF